MELENKVKMTTRSIEYVEKLKEESRHRKGHPYRNGETKTLAQCTINKFLNTGAKCVELTAMDDHYTDVVSLYTSMLLAIQYNDEYSKSVAVTRALGRVFLIRKDI